MKKPRLWLSGLALVVLCMAVLYYVTCSGSSVKNVIVVIGDGMGPQQVGLLIQYANQAASSPYPDKQAHLEKLMRGSQLGTMATYSYDSLVTDSAASATQIATGEFSRSEMVGVNKDGESVETLLEKAKRMGKSVGFVTNVRLTHATPAGFTAHRPHRSMENEIAEDQLKLEPDVMLAGGLRHWLPQAVNDPTSDLYKTYRTRVPLHINLKSKRKDDRDLIREAEEKGYGVVFTRQELMASTESKLFGAFSYDVMPDAMQYVQDGDKPNFPYPSLKEMTQKAVQVLSKNKKGFFLLVEGGLIDYAGHFNDTGMMLHELLHFDDMIGYLRSWLSQRNDTLLVVTADHETGSFGLSYSKHDLPTPKPLPGKAFKNSYFEPRFNFGRTNKLDLFVRQKESLISLVNRLLSLPKSERTAGWLRQEIKAATGILISTEEAKKVLEMESNEYFVEGHKYFNVKTVPKFNAFKEFYIYGEENKACLIGRVLAKYQQVVWGTGTHTSTPVFVIANGPKKASAPFSGLYHSTELGQKLSDVVISP